MSYRRLSFDDVIIEPNFSNVQSRKDVSLTLGKSSNANKYSIFNRLPIISSNMDTITEVNMAKTMTNYGALACLHRFWSIEENVKSFQECPKAWVSVGVGEQEIERAKALYKAGARIFVLDVAHGASTHVAKHYAFMKSTYSDIFLIVGNFATWNSFLEFEEMVDTLSPRVEIDGVKLGIGSGAGCSTRVVTGCGYPLLETILEFKNFNGLIIADGGMRTSGDIAKALAAGAHICMIGSMLAGTDATPGEIIYPESSDGKAGPMKSYRGSASKESYVAQGKLQTYISPEGESFLVPYKGSTEEVLQQIEGGLRSALSYVGAFTLEEFRKTAKLIYISQASHLEGLPHGKK